MVPRNILVERILLFFGNSSRKGGFLSGMGARSGKSGIFFRNAVEKNGERSHIIKGEVPHCKEGGFMEKHTISVLVANKFGVLARVAGLFSGRGYNISSLTVHETDDPRYSQMTIVTEGDAAILEQIDKQLRKLIDVVKVADLTGSRFIQRDMALIKCRTSSHAQQSQLIQLVETFDATIVSVSKGELGIELAGRSDQIDNFIELVRDFGVVEMARSGRVAIARCEKESPAARKISGESDEE